MPKSLATQTTIQHINKLIEQHDKDIPFLSYDRRIWFAIDKDKIIVCFNETGDCFVEEYYNLGDFLEQLGVSTITDAINGFEYDAHFNRRYY